MYKLIRPLLFGISKDPETVHYLALSSLRLGGSAIFKPILSSIFKFENPLLNQKVLGLFFKNPVGLAAGFEKDGKGLSALESLGFGFVELGGYTRLAQPGHTRPRIVRLTADEALINRMGFPNPGADAASELISKVKNISMPLGVNIAKSMSTPLENAAEDYLYSFSKFYNLVNYFVVNVSSPNTPGMRDFKNGNLLKNLLEPIIGYRNKQPVKKPILVKIVIDFSLDEVDGILEACKLLKIDGVVISNTSVSRDGLKIQTTQPGGLSGRPIRTQSTEYIKYIYKHVPELVIIGLGGIFSAEDAYEKIKAGASLVQVYTGLIYEGPGLIKKINQGLVKLLERDGFKNISEAVGIEADK